MAENQEDSSAGKPLKEGTTSTTLLMEVDPVEPERCCWICLATDADDRLAWVNPCACTGTTKWVHESCLFHWIDEKTQEEDELQEVSCPQCETKYMIEYPKLRKFPAALEKMENFISSQLCPFLMAVFFGLSVYWTAIAYGAFSFLQIAGQKLGMSILNPSDPSIILIMFGLPLIPVGLICGRLVPWEDALLQWARKCATMVRNRSFVRQNSECESQSYLVNPPLTDPVSQYRIFSGAIVLPTISYIVGQLIFRSVDNAVQRTLLGCLTFVMVKGILKIYLGHRQYVRWAKLQVLDYTEENAGQDDH
ncbi:E3 ubiquitin-protein ligase MARCHF5 [Drosophila takahashii]|uniref:E3 ubiquitin-protein ligase MARCHF5 n=1 Tax=Drosophila takahashii TaxID=29030 RepID=UPI001CF8E091|nr:E3 ubiquitin-protein ligase MARCHF5 [Drosophila takahashii]